MRSKQGPSSTEPSREKNRRRNISLLPQIHHHNIFMRGETPTSSAPHVSFLFHIRRVPIASLFAPRQRQKKADFYLNPCAKNCGPRKGGTETICFALVAKQRNSFHCRPPPPLFSSVQGLAGGEGGCFFFLPLPRLLMFCFALSHCLNSSGGPSKGALNK